MRLPLEIRYKIYKILIVRLYGGRNQDLHELALGNGIRFKVSDGDYDCAFPEIDFDLVVTGIPDQRNINSNGGPHDVNPVNLFEIYGAVRDDTASDLQVPSGWTASIVTSTKLQDISEDSAENASDESSDDDEEMKQCSEDGVGLWRPACGVRVDRAMDPDPDCLDERHDKTAFLDDCTCSYRQREDYDVIRRLSHVSSQITQELGACLWENATGDFEDPEVFFLFIRERPAVLRHIKGLVLNVQCYADPFDTLTSNLIEICDFVSKTLDLRFCTIRLFTSLTSELRFQFGNTHFLANEKVKEWKAAFQSLNIREKFDLRLDRQWGSATYGEIGSDDIGRLQQTLLDLWLPDCLRQREMAEEAVYLRSRAQ
jgi:hypothetical protein